MTLADSLADTDSNDTRKLTGIHWHPLAYSLADTDSNLNSTDNNDNTGTDNIDNNNRHTNSNDTGRLKDSLRDRLGLTGIEWSVNNTINNYITELNINYFLAVLYNI